MTLQIDINCDMGESFGLYTYGHDAEMLPLISSARPKDLGLWLNFFADRPYHRDGQVEMFNWTLEEAGRNIKALGERVAGLITRGEISSFEGGTLAMTAETVCVHSDTPGAPEILKAVRDALDESHITIAPPE